MHTARGGRVIDLSGRQTQKALVGVQLEIVMPPRSFVGSADALGIEQERQTAPEAPPAPPGIDAARIVHDTRLLEWDIGLGRLEGRHPEDRPERAEPAPRPKPPLTSP